jgi:phospholipase C
MRTSCRHGSILSRATAGAAASLLAFSGFSTPVHADETETPIEHVIIIIGENRSFDHLFATYTPPSGQSIWNLLSKGIITAEGGPGPNFALAHQFQGILKAPSKFTLTPTSKTLYRTLPPPLTGVAPTAPSDTKPPPFATLAAATAAEGQSLPAVDLPLLTSGTTGMPDRAIDTRILNVNILPSGPFQLTPGVSYDDYAASPVHRFYQMWQ